jgi:KUP system potassium uptake protein
VASITTTAGTSTGAETAAADGAAVVGRAVRPGLRLAALGVVYGDIGTSPLYAFNESIRHASGAREAAVLGVLSLFFWSITIIVSIKYISVVTRADNHGEGGILALLALVPERFRGRGVRLAVTAGLVIFGTGLLYGDGMITPAISVLSAVEGLRMVSDDPGFEHAIDRAIVPTTCVILVALFLVQRRGTARVGAAFGPVMLVWFAVLAGTGITQLVRQPRVLAALSPHHAIAFVGAGNLGTLTVLAAVVLCFTGAEALYADMGHFGRPVIRRAWYLLVMPALLLNYFGQGALVLDGRGDPHTFWAMVPEGPATVAMVLLATAATVIASQAMITGAYSLTRQAVQLGFFPRVRIIHTSEAHEGQIYVPAVNWTLAAACLALVVIMGESSRLAAAYGVAVTGTMLMTSLTLMVVATQAWRWPPHRAVAALGIFVVVDATFVTASLTKLDDGGWIPLAVGLALFSVMATWKQGRALLIAAMGRPGATLEGIAASADREVVTRVPGTGVFMTPDPETTPLSLLHYFKHSKVLPRTVVALAVEFAHVPRVDTASSASVVDLGSGFSRVTLRFGYMQTPDVPLALAAVCAGQPVPIPFEDVSYFVGRERVIATGPGAISRWRKRLYEVMSRNVPAATDFFRIPPNRVVELGAQIAL